ncbi:MAG: helix-turn-helix domain-containing protein [Candidatus Gastranaerophilales bacterium]|nr:helix-turn-helix domain-containing protein [Candidatus Gastranaerophilales bacterium]
MVLGEKLALLREKKEIYQKELATYLEVSIGTVSNYEKGIHEPDLETLCKISDYYGVTTDYLLGRTSIPVQDSTIPTKQPMDIEELFLDLTRLSPNNLEVIRKFVTFLQKDEILDQPK